MIVLFFAVLENGVEFYLAIFGVAYPVTDNLCGILTGFLSVKPKNKILICFHLIMLQLL